MEQVVEYERLLPYQFERQVEECPLAYVPEWHGEHLALGNDAIKMHELCKMAALEGDGVVFPPVFYSVPGLIRLQQVQRELVHHGSGPATAHLATQ